MSAITTSRRRQAVVRQLSGSRQAVFRQSSGSRQAVVRQSLGSHESVFVNYYAAYGTESLFSLVFTIYVTDFLNHLLQSQMDEELSEREETEVKKRSNFSAQYQHPEVQYIY